MNRSFVFQFKRFLLGGALAVGLDWGTYLILAELSGLNALTSKVSSFLLGTIFAFFFNGKIAFQAKLSASHFVRHIALYTFSLIANATAFGLIKNLFLTSNFSGTLISLIVATSISMSLNFLGMRYWVFNLVGGEKNARS